jgi:hypothetical protein
MCTTCAKGLYLDTANGFVCKPVLGSGFEYNCDITESADGTYDRIEQGIVSRVCSDENCLDCGNDHRYCEVCKDGMEPSIDGICQASPSAENDCGPGRYWNTTNFRCESCAVVADGANNTGNNLCGVCDGADGSIC